MMCSHVDDRYDYDHYNDEDEEVVEDEEEMDHYDDGVVADDTKMSSDADVTSRSTSPDDCLSRPTYYSDQIMAPTTATRKQEQERDVVMHGGDDEEEELTATSNSAHEDSVWERDEAVSLLSNKNQEVPKPQPIAATKELFKKAPNAPKQSNSAYIHFAGAMQKKIRALMRTKSLKERTANICKVVADAWKKLSPEEREPWEAIAREDRARYELEKSLYKGPWRVPKTRKGAAVNNAPKAPNLPSKPRSAFSAFAKSRRAQVKRQMPDASNGEIFKVLSNMWKDAPASVRQGFISEELEKRNIYMAAMEETQKAESTERLAARSTPERESAKNVSNHNKDAERRMERLQREPTAQSVPERENADGNIKSHDNRKNHKSQQVEKGQAPQGYQKPQQQQPQPIFCHPQSQTNEHNAHPTGSKTFVTLVVVADYSPPPLGNNHVLHPSPEPTHWKYVAYDNRAREDQQELLETFFYPDYLREAIKRATKEYEKCLQTKKAKLPFAS